MKIRRFAFVAVILAVMGAAAPAVASASTGHARPYCGAWYSYETQCVR